MKDEKIQMHRHHHHLLSPGPIVDSSWSQFLGGIRVREYGLILLALCIRGLARSWAGGA